MPAIDLSVVIVSFNTRALLEQTLRAVTEDGANLALEIIVVDNASHDGSDALVRERFPSVRLVVNADNRFYTAANNQALALAGGRHVLVLNSDAEPQQGTLPAIVDYLDRHADVGALGIRMVFPDGRVQYNCARSRSYSRFLAEYTAIGAVVPRWRRYVRAQERYESWDRSTERNVEVVPGSCLAVRREVMERVGVFDERFRHYFAEDDWCARIRGAGFAVRYAPIGTVVHPEGASARPVRRLARRLYFDDMVCYVEKHHGRARARWLWLLSRPTKWALDLVGVGRGE